MKIRLLSAIRPHAFSLGELLGVMAICAILAALAVPAFQQIGTSSTLNAAGQSVVDVFTLARQIALTRNRPVEVRIYKLPAPEQPTGTPTQYRALQILLNNAGQLSPFAKPVYLSAPIVLSDNVKTSSLLPAPTDPILPELTPLDGDPALPVVEKNYRYRKFQFQSDGSTDLPPSSSTADPAWFLSLHATREPVKATTGLPANFITVQLDPQTGGTKVYRP